MLKVSQEQELEKAVREVAEIDNEMSQFLQRLVNEVHNMPNETPPQEKMVQGDSRRDHRWSERDED